MLLDAIRVIPTEEARMSEAKTPIDTQRVAVQFAGPGSDRVGDQSLCCPDIANDIVGANDKDLNPVGGYDDCRGHVYGDPQAQPTTHKPSISNSRITAANTFSPELEKHLLVTNVVPKDLNGMRDLFTRSVNPLSTFNHFSPAFIVHFAIWRA